MPPAYGGRETAPAYGKGESPGRGGRSLDCWVPAASPGSRHWLLTCWLSAQGCSSCLLGVNYGQDVGKMRRFRATTHLIAVKAGTPLSCHASPNRRSRIKLRLRGFWPSHYF